MTRITILHVAQNWICTRIRPSACYSTIQSKPKIIQSTRITNAVSTIQSKPKIIQSTRITNAVSALQCIATCMPIPFYSSRILLARIQELFHFHCKLLLSNGNAPSASHSSLMWQCSSNEHARRRHFIRLFHCNQRRVYAATLLHCICYYFWPVHHFYSITFYNYSYYYNALALCPPVVNFTSV